MLKLERLHFMRWKGFHVTKSSRLTFLFASNRNSLWRCKCDWHSTRSLHDTLSRLERPLDNNLYSDQVVASIPIQVLEANLRFS